MAVRIYLNDAETQVIFADNVTGDIIDMYPRQITASLDRINGEYFTFMNNAGVRIYPALIKYDEVMDKDGNHAGATAQDVAQYMNFLGFKKGGGGENGTMSGLDGYVQFNTANQHDSDPLLTFDKAEKILFTSKLALNGYPSQAECGDQISNRMYQYSTGIQTVTQHLELPINDGDSIVFQGTAKAIENIGNLGYFANMFAVFYRSGGQIKKMGVEDVMIGKPITEADGIVTDIFNDINTIYWSAGTTTNPYNLHWFFDYTYTRLYSN